MLWLYEFFFFAGIYFLSGRKLANFSPLSLCGAGEGREGREGSAVCLHYAAITAERRRTRGKEGINETRRRRLSRRRRGILPHTRRGPPPSS